MVDITIISATIDITISILSHQFLYMNAPMFGHTSKDLGKILREYEGNLQLSLKTIHEIVLLVHWQLMGPMNYNNAYY